MTSFLEHVPLASRTTFQIGGTARYFAEIESDDDLRSAIAFSRERQLPFLLLAGGSNVLMCDGELQSVVGHMKSSSFRFDGGQLTADAGCTLLDLIEEGARRGVGVWESLSGIPGSIGGAVRGNAGAFGSEIKDFVTEVRALHVERLEYRSFSNAECAFAYRDSYFKQNPAWIIVQARLQLVACDPHASSERIVATIAERERRHLQNVRAAGSYFTNPVAPDSVREQFESEKGVQAREGRVPAGWLIEKVGMKGARVGGAIASVQHPNYLVNDHNASAADVRELAARIKDAVRERFNVELVEEAVVIE